MRERERESERERKRECVQYIKILVEMSVGKTNNHKW